MPDELPRFQMSNSIDPGIVTVTGAVQRGWEVRPHFMRWQPHLATGRLLRL